MDVQNRIEQLRHCRDELRKRLSSGDGDELGLRKRIVELAQEMSDLEGDVAE